MPKLSKGEVSTSIQHLAKNVWKSIAAISSASDTYISRQVRTYTENPDHTLHITAIILAVSYARPYIALITFIPGLLYVCKHEVTHVTQEQLMHSATNLAHNAWKKTRRISSASHTYITEKINTYTENPDNTLHATAMILAASYARPYIALITFIPTSLYVYKHEIIHTAFHTDHMHKAARSLCNNIQTYTKDPEHTRYMQAAGLASVIIATGIVAQMLREETPMQINSPPASP